MHLYVVVEIISNCLVFKKRLFLFFICVSLGVYLHLHAGAHRGQKRMLDSLEMELEVVVSHKT